MSELFLAGYEIIEIESPDVCTDGNGQVGDKRRLIDLLSLLLEVGLPVVKLFFLDLLEQLQQLIFAFGQIIDLAKVLFLLLRLRLVVETLLVPKALGPRALPDIILLNIEFGVGIMVVEGLGLEVVGEVALGPLGPEIIIRSHYYVILLFRAVMSEAFRKFIHPDNYPLQPHDIRFRTTFTTCILDAFHARGYRETNADDWHLCWHQKDGFEQFVETKRPNASQRINHFKNFNEICRKDNLGRNLKKYKRMLQKQNKSEAQSMNFFPLTYCLPQQYFLFLDQFKRSDRAPWIFKPSAKSQGKGSFISNRIQSAMQWQQRDAQPYVVQRYINDPLLIGGKKFDMRIYVLVTSYSPLTAYIYRSGFARFTHYRYDGTNFSAPEVHLTNVAIQKTSQNYSEKIGGKWFLGKLRLYLQSKYGYERSDLLFKRIMNLVIKTLECASKLIPADKRSFQLYGFDVLIDSQLTPWLIEINGSPSMRANTSEDYQIKCGVIDDVLTVLNLQGVLEGNQDQVGGFDMIKFKNPGKCFLGMNNDRVNNLKILAKAAASRLNKQQKVQTSQLGHRKTPLRLLSNGGNGKYLTKRNISAQDKDKSIQKRNNFQIKSGKKKKQN